MTEVHYFLAEDGSKFDYEEECREYEVQQKCSLDLINCRAFDFKMKNLSLTNVTENIISQITYIYIGDERGFKAFSELNNYYGYSIPQGKFENPLFLYYNESENVWENLEDIIYSYQMLIDRMKESI